MRDNAQSCFFSAGLRILAACALAGAGLLAHAADSIENGLALTVSLIGEGPKGGAWLRSGAQAGDVLFVTGALGGSRARKHLHFLPRLEEARLIRNLIPNGVRACIDITDGLSRDLQHLCAESRCGAAVFEDQVPISDETLQFATGKNARDPLLQALGDGEDFELLLAVAPPAAEVLAQNWRHTTKLTRIGHIQDAAQGCVLLNRKGAARPMPDVGYEHRLS